MLFKTEEKKKKNQRLESKKNPKGGKVLKMNDKNMIGTELVLKAIDVLKLLWKIKMGFLTSY